MLLGCAVASALALGLGVVVPASASATVRAPVAVAQHATVAKKKPGHDRVHHPKAHHPGARARKKKKAVPAPKPVWSPRDNTAFNYPFAKHMYDRYRIRRHIYAAVQGSPPGSRIRLATFSFVDQDLTRALIAAYRRGVSVQVLVNRKNIDLFKPFHRLQRVLGDRRHGVPRTSLAQASFARTCSSSCRGTGGNLHSKIYLFSQVGNTRWVTMLGSANLNKFAAEGQWNHLNTITGRATYVGLRHVFNQMRRDRRVRHPFLRITSPKALTWVYPRPRTTVLNDPMMRILSKVDCRATAGTGRQVVVKPRHRHPKHARHRVHRKSPRASTKPTTPAPVVRRTVIRIAMYAWFDGRGNALARAVRQKWNQGCEVRVIYSMLNAKVKRILYNPSGRGRIPMRRSAVPDQFGALLDYNHSKYVTVNGRYAGKGHRLVWTGSMNFTALGLVSDDIVVRLSGRRVYRSYLANFRRVWEAPTSTRPLRTRR